MVYNFSTLLYGDKEVVLLALLHQEVLTCDEVALYHSTLRISHLLLVELHATALYHLTALALRWEYLANLGYDIHKWLLKVVA